MKRQLMFALVLAFGLTLRLIQFASAHAFIDHCTPEVGSTVAQAPQEVRCTFTDAVDAKQTVFAVYDAKNNQVDNKDLKSDPNDPDGKTVVITLNAAKITSGLYTVKWSTVSEDGHATDGQWQFSVSAPSASAGAPTTELPASVVLSSPSEDSSFPNDPSDVVVSIKTNNFPLGQDGRRWQVYLDDKLVIQVMDGSTSAVLHAVPKGDHALKVALSTSDNTVVATAGTGFGVGPGEGDIPATALETTCGWKTLSAGGDTWYKIPYREGTQLEITLDDYGAGVGFDVWDPDQIKTWGTPDQASPVGSGSSNSAEPGHDLTWAGHLQNDGTYYAHVTNNDSVSRSYRLCFTQR